MRSISRRRTATFSRPSSAPARGGDRGHLLGDVAEDDLAAGSHAPGRREPEPAGPAGELEDPVAGAHLRQLEHPLRALRAARVGVVGVLRPAGGHRAPQVREARADRVALVGLLHHHRLAAHLDPPSNIHYSLHVLKLRLE
jgi:hypothetical protein